MRLSPLRLLTYVYPCLIVIGQYPLGSIGGVPLSFERVALLVLGPLCLLQVAMGGGNARRIFRYTPRVIIAGVFLWLGALVLSGVIQSATSDLSLLGGYVQKFLLGLLFACAVASDVDALRAIRIVALATLAASLATFYVFATQGSTAIRAASFVNPDFGNITLLDGLARAGAIGSVPLMACWLEAVFARRAGAKLMWYIGVAALFAAAMLALRREYLLSIAACLLWGTFALPIGTRRITTLLVVGGFFVFGFAIIQAVPEWRHRLLSETVESFASGQDLRLLMLQTAPKLFVEKPLLGHGLGSFQGLMASSLPVHFASDEETRLFLAQGLASHNSFLTAGLEAGVVALLGVCVVFSSLALWSVRVWRASRFKGSSPLALFAPIFFIQIFFSVAFQDGLASNMVWAFLGLLVAIIAIERSKLPGPGPWRRPPPPGSPGGQRGRFEQPLLPHVRHRRLG